MFLFNLIFGLVHFRLKDIQRLPLLLWLEAAVVELVIPHGVALPGLQGVAGGGVVTALSAAVKLRPLLRLTAVAAP